MGTQRDEAKNSRNPPDTSVQFVEELTNQGKGFCIIGLTGRVRSGTSDVCHLLTAPNFLDYMDLPGSISGLSPEENREHRIIYRYLRENWKPFIEISVTSVIISYFLDLNPNLFSGSTKPPKIYMCIFSALGDALKSSDFCANVTKKIDAIGTILCGSVPSTDNSALSLLSSECQNMLSELNKPEKLFEQWKTVKAVLQARSFNLRALSFCFGVLPVLEEAVKKTLEAKDEKYPRAFQDFGNNIRATGSILKVCPKPQNGQFKTEIKAENLFSLPRRVNEFVKILRHYYEDNSSNEPKCQTPVFVVINNFKNIFEAYYFKRRYSAFYLLSVTCDERLRQEKFNKRENFIITSLREDLSRGKKLYKSAIAARSFDQNSFNTDITKAKLQAELAASDAEMEFLFEIFSKENELRKEAYAQNIAPFVLQDVVTCIENADIFVTRNYKEVSYETEYQHDHQLIRQLARVVALILHPGLLTPTKIERCMQIAMTAKLNSGCLSRQVGAVVTDSEYNILSLGWNDAPCGAESCIRRNFFDLIRNDDSEAYSRFEQENRDFRRYIAEVNKILGITKANLKGLPMAFCFKDIYQDLIRQRDQIYTRALHGEERALASCGNDRAQGGYLFTTSSPCELCAKRAKEAKIKKIYYIQQYPGISRSHVVEVGPNEDQAEYESFVGAVGLAYVKLYTPLIPYKDELAALKFSPADAHDRWLKESQSAPSEAAKATSNDSSHGPDSNQPGQSTQKPQ